MVLHSNVIKNSVGIAVYVISYVFLQMFSSKQIMLGAINGLARGGWLVSPRRKFAKFGLAIEDLSIKRDTFEIDFNDSLM